MTPKEKPSADLLKHLDAHEEFERRLFDLFDAADATIHDSKLSLSERRAALTKLWHDVQYFAESVDEKLGTGAHATSTWSLIDRALAFGDTLTEAALAQSKAKSSE